MSRIRYVAMFLACCMAAIAQAQDLEDAVVYTVRVPLGINMTDEQLKALALTRGTVELLRFFENAPWSDSLSAWATTALPARASLR